LAVRVYAKPFGGEKAGEHGVREMRGWLGPDGHEMMNSASITSSSKDGTYQGRHPHNSTQVRTEGAHFVPL